MENKYQKVKDALKEAILSGEYAIDAKLPTETEMMKRFAVSRYTIRRAVGDLETEHFIYRIQGGECLFKIGIRTGRVNMTVKLLV